MQEYKQYKALAWDLVCYGAGSLLYAASVNIFTAPNYVTGGGLTGLAVVANKLFGFPIGAATIALNIPLFVWGYLRMGADFVKKSAVATVISSLIIDACAPFLPIYTKDVLLACIFGGVLSGIGLSLVFMRGATTGGSDLAAGILKSYKPGLSVGRIIFALDAIVVITSGVAFKNAESALYATVVIFISSRLIDAVLYGTGNGNGKAVFIVSAKSDIIAKQINISLNRGVTLLNGMGSYSGNSLTIILCALYRREFHKIERLALNIDPHCFIIAADATEIRGLGFTAKKE